RDSTAVLGPLAAYVEPHCYDLCADHASRLTAPLGWDVVRLPVHPEEPVPTQADDLEALANAVREAGPAGSATEPVGQGSEGGRRRGPLGAPALAPAGAGPARSDHPGNAPGPAGGAGVS